MKKKITVLIAVLIVLSLSGCSYKEIDDKLQGIINPAPDAVQSGVSDNGSEIEINDKGLGETHLLPMDPPKEGRMEVTLLKKRLFDTIEDSKLNVAECDIPQKVFDNPDAYIYLLLDLKIKNIDAKLMPGYDEELPFLISDMYPITEVKNDRPELGKDYAGNIYFSEHPPITSNSTDYYHYNILPGETKTVQIGIVAPKVDYENDNLWLSVGAGFGFFFELFD